jgi:hypothetical protein
MMTRALIFVAAVAACAAFLLVYGPRAPLAQPTTGGPFATNVVVGTTSVQLVAASPSRRGLTICNSASATNNVVIAPAPLTPTQPPSATSLGIGLPAATTTNCFSTPFIGGITSAWNGIATAGSTNVIVLEY